MNPCLTRPARQIAAEFLGIVVCTYLGENVTANLSISKRQEIKTPLARILVVQKTNPCPSQFPLQDAIAEMSIYRRSFR